MALSRATAAGWLVETGERSWSAAFGWFIETQGTGVSPDGTAPGVTLTGTSSLSSGSASGGGAVDGAADGVTLTGTSSLSTGSATGGASGSFVSSEIWSSGLLQVGVSASWTWYPGAVGAAPTSALVHGSGVTSASGQLTMSGLPAGVGEMLAKLPDGKFYYEPGVVS